jgi:hypothetical protein
MGMSETELERVNALECDVSELTLERVARFFELEPTSFLDEKINFREISIRHSAQKDLPDRYMVAAFGRRRATITSLDYIERKSGWRVRRDVFRHFGVNELMFSNPMAPISISFISQLSEHMSRSYAYGNHELYEMGTNLYMGSRSALIESVFSSCRNPAEIYARFFGDMMKFYEFNCYYDILKMSEDHCIFEVRSRPEVAAALGVRHLGNRKLCSLKSGIASSMTAYLGMPFAQIRELSCVHAGDSSCRFELRYSGGRNRAPAEHVLKPLSAGE